MPSKVASPEVVGVTESSMALTFVVERDGQPIDAAAEVRLEGELRARSEGKAGTRHIRIEGLSPDTEYTIEIAIPGGEAAVPDEYFSGSARTLPAPHADEVASFATMNDLHFGEPGFGGFLEEDGEFGEPRDGWDLVSADDTEIPYSQFMNEDAISEINAFAAISNCSEIGRAHV